MREILSNNMKRFFDNGFDGNCTYKGNRYEVWEVSNETFQIMCDMPEEKFVELAGEDAWWRNAERSVLSPPDTKVYINSHEMIGWTGEPWEDEDEEDEFEIYSSNLSAYLCDVIGASQPRNVCALAMDLARYNGITMGELFTKYEG